MRRLSSITTVWQKRLFPLPALIAIAIIGYQAFAHPSTGTDAWLPWLAVAAMVVVSLLVWRYRLADLADEVWLSGDELIVHKHDEQARVALDDVISVESSVRINPPRIVLALSRDSRFGQRIAFMPARPAFGFGRQPIADELRERVATAHATAASPRERTAG